MLAMSSAPSHAERFYAAMVGSMTGADGQTAFAVTPGSHMEAWCYATAMGLARERYALEHAGHEIEPSCVTESIEKREGEYGAIPADGDNLATRRGVLVARKLLPSGCAQTNVDSALSELLGADFLAYIPTALGTEVNAPATIAAAPMNLQRADLPNVLLRTIDGLSGGVPGVLTVRFDALDTSTSTVVESATTVTSLRAAVGDKIVVGANAPDTAEVVTVSAVGISSGYRTFTATFTKAHEPGSVCVIGDWPYWHSTKRTSLVVLSETAAADAEQRRKVDDQLARMAREVSRWQIAGGSGGVAGPFKVGVGLIGITPIGTITL